MKKKNLVNKKSQVNFFDLFQIELSSWKTIIILMRFFSDFQRSSSKKLLGLYQFIALYTVEVPRKKA